MSWLVIYKTKYSKQDKEQFEDIKGVIRIRRSKKDNTMAKRKRANGKKNNLQNITHNTKDRVTRTSLKPGFN